MLADAFYWVLQQNTAPHWVFAALVALAAALHAFFFLCAWVCGLVATACGARLPVRIAFTFCASQKTIVLGLPLLKACYADLRARDRALIQLPLVSYHLAALALGSNVAPLFEARVRREEAEGSERALL